MASANGSRDILNDHFLNFNCYQFSRGIRAGRPLSHRWVSAEQCLCTRDTAKICERNRSYSFSFSETSDEQEAEHQKNLSERFSDIPYDRIGVFHPDGRETFITVPPHFLDALWTAAIAADGVLRSIQLSVQPQERADWAVFEASLKEEIAESFELPHDKNSRPLIGPPRVQPMVTELRAVQALLRSRAWSSVAVIVVGVLIALWVAKLWR